MDVALRSLLVVPVLIALVVPGASAQRLPAPFASLEAQRSQAQPVAPAERQVGSSGGAVGVGLLGAMLGVIGGAVVGGTLENSFFPCHCDDPGLAGAFYGGLAGEAGGLALGAHLGNGGRGDLALDLAAAGGMMLGGFLVAYGADNVVVLVPGVALQVLVVAATERGTARPKAQDR